MSYFDKALVAWLVMLLPIASAKAAWEPTPAEMATLPPYCAARFNQGSDAFKTWQTTMGRDFIHIHHYCVGLKLLNHVRGTLTSKKNETLGAAVREFDYVLTHAAPDFYMRPEILMNRGIALSMMKRDGEAVSNLLQAIELNPKQPRAYMTLADLYDKMKNRGKALDAVSEGLRHNPDTRSLQRRYTELGGKLPYPEPIRPAQAADTQASTPADAAPSAVIEAPTEPDKSEPAAAPAPAEQPKIGSPNNPYCRFCTD